MISNYTTRHLIELRFGNKQQGITMPVDHPTQGTNSDKMSGLPGRIPIGEIPGEIHQDWDSNLKGLLVLFLLSITGSSSFQESRSQSQTSLLFFP